MRFFQLENDSFAGVSYWFDEEGETLLPFFYFEDENDPLSDYVVIIDADGVSVIGSDSKGSFQFNIENEISFDEAKEFVESLSDVSFDTWFEDFKLTAEKIYF